jgi:alkylhydroperoxidase family enzyme
MEAWKNLPHAEKGADQPLPDWARVLARTLPRTTAAMLELDYLQRARSPLDPKLRGKMRWIVAHANRCAYGEAYAAADMRRAGVAEATVQALAGDLAELPAAERAALTFARKMTLAADTVTDDEVAQLTAQYGTDGVTAMVLLLAYANFQDRLILALGLQVEDGGPLPPLEFRFGKTPADAAHCAVPPRTSPEADAPVQAERPVPDPEWQALDFRALQKGMEGQRARQPRVRVPTWEEVRKRLPPDYATSRPVRIKWSLVCMGYQPELATAWGACTRALGEEAKEDRVFEESVFWVITRTLHCFY